MSSTAHHHRPRRTVVAAALVAAAALTAGCAGTGAPAGEPASPAAAEPLGSASAAPTGSGAASTGAVAYTGPYDAAFLEDLADYTGRQVTLTGRIGELVRSRSSYVLLGPAGPELEPLLVNDRYALPEAEEGALVEVTGTLRENFDPAVVEEAVGGEEAGFYDRHRGEPYLDQAQGTVTEPAAR